MSNQEYENQEWLYAWLRHRVKYDQEYLNNIDKFKSSVKNLNFSWQNLKGKFIIENFPKLTSLNVGNNELSELEIKNCPQLREIITSHNQQLTEEQKEIEYTDDKGKVQKTKIKVSKEAKPTLEKLTITNCPEVRELYCSNNALNDLDVSKLTNLTVLAYDNNNFTAGKKTELASLGLKSENPTGKPIKVLNNDDFIDNHEITEIDISNEAGWEGLLQVKNCPNLTSLVVDNCQLEKLQIINCPNLKLLSFRHNKVKEIDLSKLTKLEGLYCSNNQLTSLIVDKNISLKHLVCDNNPIEELKVKHLKGLESLGCFKCYLTELDCSGLDKLEELYCANNENDYDFIFGIKTLNLIGCKNLEILDCAENEIADLDISDKPNLETISCKENILKKLTIKNCPELQSLDLSMQRQLGTILNVDNFNNLKKILHDKGAIVPNWNLFPNLELVTVVEEKKIYDENTGTLLRFSYSFEVTDFIAVKNTERIQNILDNPDNYSADDLFKLDKEDLYGVSTELRERLVKLMIKKHNKEIRERFTPYQNEEEESNPSEEEENIEDDELPVDTPLSTPPSEDEDEEEIPSTPKVKEKKPKIDFEKLYNELLTKIQNGELVPREQIANSLLAEDKKQELYNLLTEKENTSQAKPTLSTINYPLWISLGIVSISLVLIGYLISKKYKKTKIIN